MSFVGWIMGEDKKGKQAEVGPRNKVVVLSDKEIIEYIPLEESPTHLTTGELTFSKADAVIKHDPIGKRMVYIFNCSLPYLEDARHLRQVEESQILRQLFRFQDPYQKQPLNWAFYATLAVLFFTILILHH
jgi:hypothetical protein